MLYALKAPIAFAALVVAALVAGIVQAVVRGAAARATGLTAALPDARRPLDPRRQVDPFGLIGLVLGGVGWLRPLDAAGLWRPRKVRRITVALAGPFANIVVGLGGFVALVATGSTYGSVLADVGIYNGLHGSLFGGFAHEALEALTVMNLGMGLLALVPIWPLPGADVMFTLAPRSPGWQKVRHYMVDQNWGIGVVLLLLILPLGSLAPALLALVDAIGHPILTTLSHLRV